MAAPEQDPDSDVSATIKPTLPEIKHLKMPLNTVVVGVVEVVSVVVADVVADVVVVGVVVVVAVVVTTPSKQSC